MPHKANEAIFLFVQRRPHGSSSKVDRTAEWVSCRHSRRSFAFTFAPSLKRAPPKQIPPERG